MYLPDNDVMLLSIMNTKLRDEYSSFDLLCEEEDVDKEYVVKRLEKIGYIYDENLNKFI